MPSISRDQFNLTKCFKTSKSKEKSPSFRKKLSSYFTEFSDNTGIQGFKYIGETERSSFEKICWLIALCISLYICVSLIKLTWRKWDENPVFISFSPTPKRVWDIPFPAVTICPEAKIKTERYNFTYYHNAVFKLYQNLTAEEVKNYADSQLPCTSPPVRFVNHTTGEETVRRIIQNAPTLNETIMYCFWTHSGSKCDTIFTPILTNNGVCFTFNMVDKNELYTNITYIGKDHVNNNKTSRWTVDNNYIRTTEDVYPRRAKSAIKRESLTVYLTRDEEDVEVRECNLQAGFRIMLHHPAESPRKSTRDLQLLFNDYDILVKPEITTTSSALINYEPHRRKCYFSNERQLKFFKIYTEENCQTECLANYILTECRCAPYYMPREKSTRICGLNEFWCVQKAEGRLLYQVMELEVSGDGNKLMSCDCLPSCTSIIYNSEFSQINFNYKVPTNYSSISIFFKDDKFISMERNELFGDTDFWANCGGLLGLFTGFSVMSLIEIVYFLSMRWMCNMFAAKSQPPSTDAE